MIFSMRRLNEMGMVFEGVQQFELDAANMLVLLGHVSLCLFFWSTFSVSDCVIPHLQFGNCSWNTTSPISSWVRR